MNVPVAQQFYEALEARGIAIRHQHLTRRSVHFAHDLVEYRVKLSGLQRLMKEGGGPHRHRAPAFVGDGHHVNGNMTRCGVAL